MRDIKVASRYANSLLKIAIQENSLEDLFADMQAIKQVCDGSRDLELVLKSPIIKSDKKQEILDAIFGKNLSKMSILFIALIIKKKRAGLMGYGIEIIENISLEIDSNEYNKFYLETKRDKMGHTLKKLDD